MTRAFLIAIVLQTTLASGAALADPAAAVVKITAFTRMPDPLRPWQKSKPVEGFGSGVYIGNNRILTNNHVVNYATEIYVQWKADAEKTEAILEAQSVDLDLAVLKVADPAFFDKRKPLPRAKDIPRLKDIVTVFGFPRGGAGLAITRGEVSRINSIAYGSEGYGLQIQTSAPVNPGNSGGPAVVGDQMIGIVYSRPTDAQNIGYVIPCEEIDLFLRYIKDGAYTGKPRVNTLTRYQSLENETLRRWLKIDKSVQGVMMVHARGEVPLKDFDIVTKIGDHPVDNRGNIQLLPDLPVFFMYLVPRLTRNDSVPLTVRRGGKTIQIDIPVQYADPFVMKRYRGEPLPYFIHGPLVFVPAKLEDFNDFYTRLNPNWLEGSLGRRRDDYVRFPGEELVVISTQFRHKTTNGYLDHAGRSVKAINGVEIKNLRHLVTCLRDARDPFLKIEFADTSSSILVFDRLEIENATEQILEDNGIAPTRRGSTDMMAEWRKKK